MESIIRFLFSSMGNTINKPSIAKATDLPGSTIVIYLKTVKDAFLTLACDIYDMVGKKHLNTNGKYYAIDLGLRKTVFSIVVGTDTSKPLENLVCIELLRRGYKTKTGSYKNSEIVLAVEHDSIKYYQVC